MMPSDLGSFALKLVIKSSTLEPRMWRSSGLVQEYVRVSRTLRAVLVCSPSIFKDFQSVCLMKEGSIKLCINQHHF